MATILGKITINEREILDVDSNPATTPGTSAPIGSLAISDIGRIYFKSGVNDIDWVEILSQGNLASTLPINFIYNMAPDYVSSNTIKIQHGIVIDDTETIVIKNLSDINVSLTASGAGGLDTGTKQANTWYYIWVISNDTGSSVSAVFSNSRTSVVLPSGYTKKRVLRAAFRTDSSGNMIPFTIGAGWPHHPEFYYDSAFDGETVETTNLLHNVVSTSFIDLNCSAFVPPTSARGIFYVWFNANAKDAFFRPNGTTHNGIRFRAVENPSMYTDVFLNTDDDQIMEYKTSSSANLHLAVRGFVITQEH